MLVFFLVKLLLVSIHLFRIIEKSLGLFRQADLQDGKGREMLRMCLVEWRMLIKINETYKSLSILFNLQTWWKTASAKSSSLPNAMQTYTYFNIQKCIKTNLRTFLKVYPFLSNIICAKIIRMFHVKNTKYNKVTHPTIYVFSIQ